MRSVEIITRPRWQIRVLSGPAAGSVHLVDRPLHIGRGEDADILLMDDAVSRLHAKIVEDDDGQHVLVDLQSHNGTFMEGRRIRQRTLEAGMVFEITRTKLLYEEARPFLSPRRPVPLPLTDEFRTRRETTPHRATRVPRPESSAPLLCAVDERGIAYPGDLVGDVLEFRRLLARLSCGALEAGPLLEHFDRLESRFRFPKGPARSSRMDRYRRFFCSVPTRVCASEASDIPVVVIDFGPDGAQLFSYGRRLAVDSVLWLMLDTEQDGEPQTLLFPGHVDSSTEDYAQLSFTGEPTPLLRSQHATLPVPSEHPPAGAPRPWSPR